MKIITVYAIVLNGELVSSRESEQSAMEYASIMNSVHKTTDYIVVPCNGVLIVK